MAKDIYRYRFPTSVPVGRDLNRLFVGFLRREFGEDAFTVERVNSIPHSQPQEIRA